MMMNEVPKLKSFSNENLYKKFRQFQQSLLWFVNQSNLPRQVVMLLNYDG